MYRTGRDWVLLSVIAVLPVAVGFWLYLAMRSSQHGAPSAAGVSEPYDEQAAIKAAEAISAKMIGYVETTGFAVPFREPRAMFVDNKERIFVAGDRAVAAFSSDGQKLSEIALKGEPRCLTVGGPEHGVPGQLYVGMEDHVEVFDPQGEHVATWPTGGTQASFTSIATLDFEVWVADAGSRLVWRYDLHGKPLSPVGQSRTSPGSGEFVVTSHYFDLAAGRDGLVYIVNPRLLRVEGYTASGDREATWGTGSPAVADFFGCCNPAHLAVLPDGNFVTAEKGIPRVKIYTRRGEFVTVVAGPPQLKETPVGLGGDRKGRVYVLDAQTAKVRVFEKKPDEKGEKQSAEPKP